MILYLDPFAGISGDMFLGMMLDLGVPLEAIQAELNKLGLEDWALLCHREKRRGIEGTRALVKTQETSHHRTWSDIDMLLSKSSLDEKPRTLARTIFRRLGEAEAAVHGIPLEDVHFHEVGALDAIVDIVGAAVAFSILAPRQAICGPLPASHGTVETEHGLYPLPAPATLKLLEGWPMKTAAAGMEWVTPTGAAIVTTIAEPGDMPEMVLSRTGYGVGSRDPESIPNLLRGMLGQVSNNGDIDQVSVIECHLDDANPEWLGALQEHLLENGALDVTLEPVQMKKNRPGIKLCVVAKPAHAESITDQILLESSAIGVRSYLASRKKLRRETAAIVTPIGEARIKRIYSGEKLLRITAEYESCRQLSAARDLPLPEVYRIVEQAAWQLETPHGAP